MAVGFVQAVESVSTFDGWYQAVELVSTFVESGYINGVDRQ